MYPMDPERRSHQREYEEPERCSQRREYGEPERCSQRREYGEPERCFQRREYGEPERFSQRREYGEPERCSQRREYGEPERFSQRREYGEPERFSQRREYGEPERCSQRREYREPRSGQWDDGLETRGNGQAMARDLYSEYSSMRRTREDWEDYGASSDMSYTMDPSSRDWSEGSLRGSGAPFSPDTDGDVDGDPVELSVEDLELLQNRMEIIEEQMALKKAVLAMELVGPESKAICKQKTKDKDLEVLTTNVSNNDVTLKERVNCILRKRAWTNECRSKEAANQKVPPKLVLHPPKVVKSFVERMNESILHKDSRLKGSLTLDVHEEEHPLKLKVEALLAQRHNPTVNKEDKAAKGFQHFLDVLHKGVDIDRLSKIVNNSKDLPSVGEELPQGQPPPLHGQPETNSKSERTVPSRKRRSRFDEFPQGSNSQKTVGLDLGVEELGRLNNRIQERLYGKKRDLGKKGGKKESVWGVEKEESKKGKEESEKDKQKEKEESEEDKQKEKEESEEDKQEKEESEEDKQKEKEESEEDKEKEKEKDKQKEKEEREKDKQKEKEESKKDKEESACSSKCHSITLLSDGSNSSPPCHRWTAKYKCSSTRDQDRDSDRGRSERDRDRRSSTRDQDRDRDRDRGRSERDRDRRSSTRDQDRERYRDRGRSERDRDRGRSERDRDRGRSERDRDRRSSTRDKDRDRGRSERDRDRGRSERDRDRRSSTRDQDRDWGRSERDRDRRSSTRDQDRERYRDRRSSTRDQDRERYRDRRSSTRDQDRERDGSRSERDKDRERWWERDKEWDGDKESFRGLYPYSNNPTHPPASLMATDPVQYSQYMAYHGSPYASAFPPGCSFPPGTVFPSTMPPSTVLPGTVPLPNPLGYPLYPNCPPSYYSGPSERFSQPYTQATGNPQFTNMDVQVQDPYASLSIPEREIETVWPRLVHPSINQDSKPAGLNRLSIKKKLKRERYRTNSINCKNIQELRQLKEIPLVAATEPGTKKVPEGDAVIEGEKLHFVVPPVATTYSWGPCRTGFPNRKGRKGKTLEEKGLFNQGLSMRNRAYMTRWKQRFAEAVAKGLEVPSEPEPKTAPEAKDKSLTEWQRLFADSVVNVAATDLSALSEPEAEKKPDWETEQKRTDEEMKVKLKKKLDEFNLKMKQKSMHLKEVPT
ncbi:uncharacterized protein LOC118364922 [Oncorhynchus keta]|uniref:uncharacterized protein LOC118364922 n=1 Tax=Oncorhynchus keta TaxID=8018 RepID=UPI00227C9674|nr:uncharacterized protein LOC118364922 [Oncorhynchus keta]XP_052346507.1 uncharacterized protein LOC118364922 [Oncorhynchus keta]XP_052346508.1 uncharacterized protein LOC118364922 [Oncorhynchus keta]